MVIPEIHYLDDSDDEAFISKLLLERQQVSVRLKHHVTYASLKAAMKKRDADQPMVILVDLNMPGINGNEALKLIDKEFGDARLIAGMCSGSDDPADRQNAFKAGAHFFVNKPLDKQCLAAICGVIDQLHITENDAATQLVWAA
ncbi:putative two-component response regulator protein [Ahrensia sp. R2A130]|nr:putative two-component response regulator protein [Ahrensia sp. R2A130]